MKKSRLSVYLDKDTLDALSAYAHRRGQPLSFVAERAIVAFVDPEQGEAAILKRLSRFERHLQHLERDMQISIESFMVFVWFWMTTNPPLPEPAMNAARAAATERYDAFMDTLGQRLAKGTTAKALFTQSDGHNL